MGVEIPITGITDSFRPPGVWGELLVAQGEGAANVGEREAVVVGPILSTANWTAAELQEPATEQDFIDGAAAGSPLHRLGRAFRKANPLTTLYALGVAETSGGTPAPADVDVTVAGSPAAAGGVWIRVCGVKKTYAYTTSDTATTCAAGLCALMNGETYLPVTLANVAGVITVTAKLDGESQGDGTVGVIQVQAGTDTNGITISPTSAEVGDTVAGAEGSTTEAANLATALAPIDSRRIYYIISSAYAPDVAGDVAIDNLTTHITNKSYPNPGHRSTGVVAYTGAAATAQLLAVAQNYERLILACQENSDSDLAELAGSVGGVLALEENRDATYNFCQYSKSNWKINKAYATSDWFTTAEINDLLNDGVTPIQSTPTGSYIVAMVCTRSKDSTGAVDDYRATERQRVSGGDFVLDKCQVMIAKNHLAKKLVDDEFLDDGSVDPNQPVLHRDVRRPSMVKGDIIGLLQDMDAASNKSTYTHLQKLSDTIASLNVVKSKLNPSRVAVSFDLYTVDHLNQATLRVAEATAA